MSLQSEKLLSQVASLQAAARPRDALKRELAAEILERFSALRFVAYGSSMLPSIYPGDCLIVESFGWLAPSCGDIVLCRRGDQFCIHRIVGISGEGADARYILRGDALLEDDPPVLLRKLLGRVTSVLRHGRPLDLDHGKRIGHRLLRSMVRRLDVTSAVLLSLAQRRLRKLAAVETECA